MTEHRCSNRAAAGSTAGLSQWRPFGANRMSYFCLLLLFGLGHVVWAADAYTDRALFTAAQTGTRTVVDFDDRADGFVISSGRKLDGITFTYSLAGTELQITDAFPAPSPQNSLGSTAADILRGGDKVLFSFTDRQSFGLLVITAAPAQPGDFTLNAGGAEAMLNPDDLVMTLSDGATVYFLGITSTVDVPLNQATLISVDDASIFYNLDDLESTLISDSDNDGVLDATDNCTEVHNPEQRDTDDDGYGNYCDADFDNSEFVNFADLAIFKSKFGTNDEDGDLDSSGFVNFADLAIFKSLFGQPPGPAGNFMCEVDEECPRTGACVDGFICGAALSGRIFIDNDADGVFSGGDLGTGLAVVWLEVRIAGTWIRSNGTIPSTDGFYFFGDLNPLYPYRIVVEPLEGMPPFAFTASNLGGDDTIDSDVDSSGVSPIIDLDPEGFDPTIWAGILP